MSFDRSSNNLFQLINTTVALAWQMRRVLRLPPYPWHCVQLSVQHNHLHDENGKIRSACTVFETSSNTIQYVQSYILIFTLFKTFLSLFKSL